VEQRSRIASPVVWQLLSFALFFGLWEVAGRWPISFAFPPFSKTFMALLRMIADGSLPKAYLSTLQPLVIGIFLCSIAGIGFGIGMGHFIHAMRRNLNLTYIVMDNEVYGLTTGQASPTTTEGHKTKSTPRGNVEKPIQPLALAIATGATYVARGFSGEPKQLTKLIAGAIAHKGFSLIDVFSPCVTFNKINTYPWFKERLYKLEDSPYDPTDLMAAMEKSMEWGSRIPIGLLYRHEKPTYEDTEPVLAKGPLVQQPLGLDRKTLDELLAETM